MDGQTDRSQYLTLSTLCSGELKGLTNRRTDRLMHGKMETIHEINTLPNDKISDLSKFKAYADDNIYVGKMAKFVFI